MVVSGRSVFIFLKNEKLCIGCKNPLVLITQNLILRKNNINNKDKYINNIYNINNIIYNTYIYIHKQGAIIMGKTRFTMYVREELIKKLKINAIENNTDVSAILEKLIEEYLKK